MGPTAQPAQADKVSAAIKRSAPSIAHTSAERIGEELVIMMTEGGAAHGIDLLVESGLGAVVMPELLALPSCPQPPNFHPEGDVYRHTRLMLSMLIYKRLNGTNTRRKPSRPAWGSSFPC